MSDRFTFTSESVTEGHPDKMCDQISDAVLDAILEQDPESRVSRASRWRPPASSWSPARSARTRTSTIPRVVRDTVCGIGYTDAAFGFDGKTCSVITSIDEQSPDIAMGVDKAAEQRAGTGDRYDEIGAGDQGMMFGYACDDTDDLMPMPIWLAHRLARAARRGPQGRHARLPAPRRQDPGHDRVRGRRARSGSSTVLISTQTAPGIDIARPAAPRAASSTSIAAADPRAVRRRRLRVAVQPDRAASSSAARTPTVV